MKNHFHCFYCGEVIGSIESIKFCGECGNTCFVCPDCFSLHTNYLEKTRQKIINMSRLYSSTEIYND